MIRTIRRTSCIACGSDSAPLYSDIRDTLYGAPGTWTVVQCANPACRLVWLDPAPHADDLIELYTDYYTHGEEAQMRGMQRVVRSAYRAAVACLLAPLGLAAERRRAEVMFLQDDSPATLLDVGCGDGGFLATMAVRGWSVTGVDFDAVAVRGIQERLGLEAHVGTAESMAASGRRFDVVTAHHVIEHVPDPVKFLVDCAKMLHAGGRVIIRTPNAASLGLSLYGRSWRGLEPPRHLQIFTRPSLLACGEKAGLQVSSCFSTDANAGQIMAASHFLKKHGRYRWELLSKADIIEWMTLSPLFALRARFALRRDRNSGEELHATFRRK